MGELDEACLADPACVSILAEAPGGEGATVSGLLSVLITEANVEPFTVSLAALDTSGEAVADGRDSVRWEILYVEVDRLGPQSGRQAGGGDEAVVLAAAWSSPCTRCALGTYAVTCADRLPFTVLQLRTRLGLPRSSVKALPRAASSGRWLRRRRLSPSR